MLVLEYVIRDKHYIGDLQIFYRNRIVTFFSAMIDKLFQFRSLLQIYIYFSAVKIIIQFVGFLEKRIDLIICYGATHAYMLSLQQML